MRQWKLLSKDKVSTEGLTFRRLSKENAIFIPAGSFECHGKMLPLGTDSFIATAFCQEFAKKVNGIALPLVNYSPCYTTKNLPITVHITNEHFKQYLADICTSLWNQNFKKIIIVSIHSGCAPVIKTLVDELFDKGIIIFYYNPFRSGAEEIDKEIFKGRNNNHKECSLLLAALKILGEEDILKGTLSRKVNEKPNRNTEIEKVRLYGTMGFSYDKPADHVAGTIDADINQGFEYYNKQVKRFLNIIPMLEKYWQRKL